MSDLFQAGAVVAMVDELRAFVAKEFATQRRAFKERRSLPVVERVERGSCLAGLCFQCLNEKGLAEFRHDGNDSRLREGDRVQLSRDKRDAEVAAWIFREEENRIWLAADSEFPRALLEASPRDWILDEDFVDLQGRYLEALDQILRSQIGQDRILPLLAGNTEPGFDEDEYHAAMAEMDAAADAWEDAQQEAIAACLAAEHCYLVQGPPGTGKTWVLAEVVAQLVTRGERVLITAFTHRAIDNALAAAARRIGDRQRVARFGDAIHQRTENYELYGSFAESPLVDQAGGWVAAATPFALKNRLPEAEFDVIVIDEAGQMTTTLAIMAMLAGRKYLLFGDEQQLGPVVISESRREARYRGIFHSLRGQSRSGTCLDVSYRLNDRLAHWPSESFYGGELHTADCAARRRLSWRPRERQEDWVKAALEAEEPLIWIAFPPGDGRVTNPDEIAVTVTLLEGLWEGGVRWEDMAVVTPYRRQARHLRRRLETVRATSAGATRSCVIDTVERMQGQEREVTLLSFCASDPNFIARQADFLFDPRRLNVSITRARTKLVILASDALLKLATDDPDLADEIDLFRSLRREAKCLPAPNL